MVKVLGFKLKNGQDVIGRVVDDGDIVLTIEFARLVLTQAGANGQLGVSMPPWSALNMDGPISIHIEDTLTVFDSISPDIERMYLEATSPIDLSGK